MIKKKILIAAVVAGIVFSLNSAFAEPIVELAAPRTPAKIMPADTSTTSAPIKSKAIEAQDKKAKEKIQPVKKCKRHIHKKPPQIKVDYNEVSKMIEYGYYDEADKILEGAIARNSKDIKAQALWVVSLAKQCKLDPAQDELNELLPKYPDNSNLHYAQGVVYYQRTTSSNMVYRNNAQKLICDAMREFQKSMDLDKNNARAYNAAGVMSIKLGNNKDAVDYFKKALVADKTYSLAIDNLGTIDFSAGKLKDAEKKFKESLSYNTQNTTAMYHLAQIAMQNQDYATALTYLNNALYINQNSPAIYNLMGKAYVAQGNEAAAINAFRQSVKAKPEFTVSYLDLADVYDKRGDNEFAIEQLKTALSIEPDYYDARLKMADISLNSGKYKQAIDTYALLVGVTGYNDSAIIGLANSYYGQAQVSSAKALLGSHKDLYNALGYINKALDLNNRDLELHLAKLKLTKITNQPDLSKIELNKIVQSPANDLMSMVVKGEAYLTMCDYQNAQKTFDSAIKLASTPDDDLYLSEILLYHKQYDCAQKVLQQILGKDAQNQQALNDMDYIQKCKKYADNYFKSAKSFLKSGNLSTAMEYLSRSLAVNPNNPQAHLLLAQLYEKQKNYDDAVMNYKAYLGLEANTSDAKKVQEKIRKLESRL